MLTTPVSSEWSRGVDDREETTLSFFGSFLWFLHFVLAKVVHVKRAVHMPFWGKHEDVDLELAKNQIGLKTGLFSIGGF